MTEQALTDLVQKTFDAVSEVNSKLDTTLTRLDSLESRHVEQVRKQDKDHDAVTSKVEALARDHNALKNEVVAIKASRWMIGGGSLIGGGGLGALLQAMLGGILLAAVVGCSGPSTPPVVYGGMSGRCAADLTLYVESQPLILTINGEGGHQSGGATLVGSVGVEFSGWRLACEGEPDKEPRCDLAPIVAGPGVPASGSFQVDPSY